MDQHMLAAMMQQQGMMAGHQQWSAQSGQQWGGAASPQALMAQQALMAAQGGMGSGIPNMGMPMSPGMMQMNMAHQNRRTLLLAAQTHGGGSSGEPQKEGPPGCNLFVYHCPPTWGDNQLTAHFASHGKIVSATIMTNKSTGLSKGFGFVSFDNPESAENAIAAMNGFEVEGKRLKVQHKTAKGELGQTHAAPGTEAGVDGQNKQHGPKGCNLFVYHCPPTWGDDDITTAFASYGTIVSATIMKDKETGASKGFGSVLSHFACMYACMHACIYPSIDRVMSLPELCIYLCTLVFVHA